MNLNLSLEALLKGLNYSILQYDSSSIIRDVKVHSNKVEENDLYIAIRGEKYDGHDFIEESICNGATSVIINRTMTQDILEKEYKNINIISVEDTRIAASYIIQNRYGNPSSKYQLVGVTGTNGKTSVTTIAKHILMRLNCKVGLIGTIENYVDNTIVEIDTTTATTPDFYELGMIMNRFVEEQVDISLMEVSSMALKNHRVDGCDFDIGVFTNLSPEHLDDHKTMEDYLESKLLLFDQVKSAAINIDDSMYEQVLNRCNGNVISYGIYNKNADLLASNIRYRNDGVEYLITYEQKTYEGYTSTPCEFAIYNILAAISIGILLGENIEDIITYSRDDIQVRGRFELLQNRNGIRFLIDYAHTPVTLESLLESVRKTNRYKEIITVFGCGGNRDKTKRSVMGEISQRLSDYTILTSDNPRDEDAVQIIDDIRLGMNENIKNFTVVEERKSAIELALSLATKDTLVIIAGKGHESYQEINGVRIPFDDKEVVEKYQFI